MNRGLTIAGWASMAFLSVAIALVSYRYLPGVGPLATNIMANPLANPFLNMHVAGAATALLTGPFQFLATVRRRWPRVHRWVGRTYVVGCLFGAAGSLPLAFGSTAGPIATAGFGSLAVIWAFVNVQGWRTAMAGRFGEHRAWMIRSFALTFGAVTLRLYLPLIPLTGLSFVEGYRAISFLAWVPNLILAELYIRGAFNRTSGLRTAQP